MRTIRSVGGERPPSRVLAVEEFLAARKALTVLGVHLVNEFEWVLDEREEQNKICPLGVREVVDFDGNRLANDCPEQ